jgi:hypothetical protein
MKETSEVSSNGNPQSSVSMEETPKGHGWKPTMVMDMISLKYTYIKQGIIVIFQPKSTMVMDIISSKYTYIKQGYYCYFSTKEG